MKFYSEEQLVKFGKYLLSEERASSIKTTDAKTYNERKSNVYDSDIANSGIIESDFNLAE